jgi:hypothetical protein
MSKLFGGPANPKKPDEWMRDPDDHAVYIMGHLDAEYMLCGPTKVGISKNPKLRLKQVQAVEPGRIVLVGFYWFWRRSHACMVEKGFHDAFQLWRERGEWFDMDPQHAVGVMIQNLQAFADRFLGADEMIDRWSAYDHLGVPGFAYLSRQDEFPYQ